MIAAKSMGAGQFKARCLAVLDRVARTGESVVVTKRGKPVAKIVAIADPQAVTLRGSVTFHGELVGPIVGAWDMDG